MENALCLTWNLTTVSGYGIYGLQIVLQMIRRGAAKIVLTTKPSSIMLPPLTAAKLQPVFELATKLDTFLAQNPDEMLAFRHPALHAVGNDFAGFAGQGRVLGAPNVGCAALEHKIFTANGKEISKAYTRLIAISKWNETFLKELDTAPVHLCYQGIDTSLFHPAPRTNLWKDRFVIFSGGKFEFRKGQDIVLAAYKIFQARHPEALLVTCWQNLLPLDPAPFVAAGHCSVMPEHKPTGLHIEPWLLAQGLPKDSFISFEYTPNMLMPSLLNECDAAIFPNRCEGGTNLVAMEAMACGVPTYVSNNTGQKDLVEMLGCGAFMDQRPVKATEGMMPVEDWGETSVDEVVTALEHIYTAHAEEKARAAHVAEKIKAFDWSPLNDKLLDVVFKE